MSRVDIEERMDEIFGMGSSQEIRNASTEEKVVGRIEARCSKL